MTTALTEPSVFVRVVASLMPKELEATITVVHADRMSDDELAALGLNVSPTVLERADD
jgi:hypothetical protein